jgi:hypothetical protein
VRKVLCLGWDRWSCCNNRLRLQGPQRATGVLLSLETKKTVLILVASIRGRVKLGDQPEGVVVQHDSYNAANGEWRRRGGFEIYKQRTRRPVFVAKTKGGACGGTMLGQAGKFDSKSANGLGPGRPQRRINAQPPQTLRRLLRVPRVCVDYQ